MEKPKKQQVSKSVREKPRMSGDPSSSAGFTLVEVMSSLALIGVVFAGLWSLYNYGRQTQVRCKNIGFQSQSVRGAMEVMSADFQAGSLNWNFSGEPDRVSFGCWRGAETDSLRRRSMTERRAESYADLSTVNIRLTAEGKLVRTEVVDPYTPDSPGVTTVLAEKISELRFRYFTGSEWRDSWESAHEECLPVAVDIHLTVGNLVDPEGDADAAFAENEADYTESLDEAGILLADNAVIEESDEADYSGVIYRRLVRIPSGEERQE
jgi:prepilin-type N-terminal cleavage/methylation domain-containing protein